MVNFETKDNRIEIVYDSKTELLVGPIYNGIEWIIKIKNKESVNIQKVSESKYETFSKDDLPTVDDIIKFIESKPNFEHDNAEIHEEFLGRVIRSRDETKLYHALATTIRKAKDNIEKKYNGKWESNKKRSLQNSKPVKVFTFNKEQAKYLFNYGENKIE